MPTQPTGYESPSWWYDFRGFFILKLAYRGSLLSQVRFFSDNISPKHLEIAIGSGTLFSFILLWRKLKRKSLGEVTAIDYADQMLRGARRRFRKKAHFKLLEANVHRLPFPDQSFSTINVANAMHCFTEIDQALSEMYRVLTPGGRVAVNVLTFPTGNSLPSRIAKRVNAWGSRKGILHRPYKPEEIKSLARRAGFQIHFESKSGNELRLMFERPRSFGLEAAL